eukprot:SAG22_NODE_15110_length_356_cov_1.809339_1_plen_86_part_10
MIYLLASVYMHGVSAGIATCAGSAIFNAAVIPATCILAVTIKGVDGVPVEKIALQRSTLIRDGIFFVLSEILLIGFWRRRMMMRTG